jgi:predicted DNA-binding protein YlxM (UPF0122 family)
MDNQNRIANLAEGKYLVTFGIRKPTFDKMLEILESEYMRMHRAGGRPPRLNVLDKLVVTIGYYHDYRTMENIAFDYGVSKSRICDAVKWVEQTIIKDGCFALPSKRELVKSYREMYAVIIDAAECETERPKKNKKEAIRGSKNGTR